MKAMKAFTGRDLEPNPPFAPAPSNMAVGNWPGEAFSVDHPTPLTLFMNPSPIGGRPEAARRRSLER
jgi:hypothetical protein